jgi:hypothetical protein
MMGFARIYAPLQCNVYFWGESGVFEDTKKNAKKTTPPPELAPPWM